MSCMEAWANVLGKMLALYQKPLKHSSPSPNASTVVLAETQKLPEK
jgi:hypothetical protein